MAEQAGWVSRNFFRINGTAALLSVVAGISIMLAGVWMPELDRDILQMAPIIAFGGTMYYLFMWSSSPSGSVLEWLLRGDINPGWWGAVASVVTSAALLVAGTQMPGADWPLPAAVMILVAGTTASAGTAWIIRSRRDGQPTPAGYPILSAACTAATAMVLAPLAVQDGYLANGLFWTGGGVMAVGVLAAVMAAATDK